MQPPLLERDLVDMFMGNLQGPYLDRMVGGTSSGFSYLVLADERIENMVKMGKIQSVVSSSGVVKKPYVAFGKKREGETNEAAVVRGMAPIYCAPYQQVVTVSPVQNQQPYTISINQQPTTYQQQYAS